MGGADLSALLESITASLSPEDTVAQCALTESDDGVVARIFVGRACERAYSRNKRRFDRAQVARGPHVNATAADLLNGQWWSERALARPAPSRPSTGRWPKSEASHNTWNGREYRILLPWKDSFICEIEQRDVIHTRHPYRSFCNSSK